jgi:catechol 2,3-dioxygenase-like lactoylglutathione lyase family enzyme
VRGNRLDVHTHGHNHRWGTIVEGSRKRLSHLSFGVFEDDFPRFKERLNNLRVPLLEAPPGFESNGLWFHSPDGLLMELRVADKTSPNEKSSFMMASAPAGTQSSPNRSQAPRTNPRRLAHVLVFTADVAASIAFYERVLGLRLSDRSNDGIAFMHGIHGSDHHLLALAKAQGPGPHHLSWDVGSINDIGLGATHMADKGYALGGDSDVTCSVLIISITCAIHGAVTQNTPLTSTTSPSNCDWHGQDNPGHDSFYLWGPTPPKDFAVNHEMAS